MEMIGKVIGTVLMDGLREDAQDDDVMIARLMLILRAMATRWP